MDKKLYELHVYGYEAGCPACNAVKELLKKHKMDFEFIPVEYGKHPFKTVPQVFMSRTWIGDYSMLKNHLDGGKDVMV